MSSTKTTKSTANERGGNGIKYKLQTKHNIGSSLYFNLP